VRRTAALIVGGGPAGASAAIALARGGAMPVLIDRPDTGKGVAIAFGPGLAAEGFHFERCGEPQR
jgi:2-polyprenyl-6-methoxyphenol hydroxylase-like FAD-dependent oxidoreductase